MTESSPVPASRITLTGGGPGEVSHATDPFGRPRRPHVAILGFTDHRKLAPFHDPSFEVWGLNELYRYMDVKLFTRWFEIHDRAYFEQNDAEHLKALATLPIPVYMQTTHPDIPNAVPLPKAAIERVAGTYMTSSIAWMIGLAILEGFEKIHVYGVDMAQDTEYKEQRPCCEYLIGLARGMGIDCYVPPTSDLMKSVGQYGFGEVGSAFSAKIVERMEWLMRERTTQLQRLDQLEGEYRSKLAGLNAEYEKKKTEWTWSVRQLEGAYDDCVYWKRSWAITGANVGGGAPHPDRGIPTLAEQPGDGAVPTAQPAAVAA